MSLKYTHMELMTLNTGEFVNPETNEIVEPLPATLMGSSQCNDIAVPSNRLE